MGFFRTSFTWCAFVAGAALAGAALAPLTAQQAAPYKDESKIPDTPACKRALEVIDIVNKGDEALASAYILENFTPDFRNAAPMEEHLRIFAGLHEESDGFEVHSARIYDPPRPATSATIVVRNRLSEAWEAFVVYV